MDRSIATIKPRSAFGGPIRGDTLFGQLCWAARHRWGEDRLSELLQGYTEGQPYLVVSDAFPAGYLPRPALPMHRFDEVPDADRKAVKKRRWLPRKHFAEPLRQWLNHAKPDSEISSVELIAAHIQPHNTINRMTGTTGTGEFAPYTMARHWFAPDLALDIYLAYDAERLSENDIRQLLEDVGHAGYGRDASIGLGKFEVSGMSSEDWPAQDNANAMLTLAPCAPQGLGFDASKSWYQLFTRFGRHGDVAVHTGRPFKNPLLMADAGALLARQDGAVDTVCGQGLGGSGQLSKAIESTVHQGYAPALPVFLEETS